MSNYFHRNLLLLLIISVAHGRPFLRSRYDEIVTPNNRIAKDQRQLNPSKGKIHALVLLVRFADHKDRELPTQDYFENLCNNGIRDYMTTQSYGKYEVSGCDVLDWMDTNNTEAYYADGVSNFHGNKQSAAMFLPLLDQLEDSVDWSIYDADGDGLIDALLVIHSGHGAEQGTGTSCGEANTSDRIQTQAHNGNDIIWQPHDASKTLTAYAIISAFDRVCDEITPAQLGIITHEWMHMLGALDLYDLQSKTKLGGLGVYDIMSNAYGPTGNGGPAGLSAYSKQLLDWLAPTEIEYDGIYSINVISWRSEAYKITKGYATGEYLLIENRSAMADFDVGLPGKGLLIYHIDEDVPYQDKAGFPGQDGWPSNGNHYKVALLQSDGYDIEQQINNGDEGDYWTAGRTLGPGGGDDNLIYPNTDSYHNGEIVATGVTISDISKDGYAMTFRVSGLGSDPTFADNYDFVHEINSELPTTVPTASFGEMASASPSKYQQELENEVILSKTEIPASDETDEPVVSLLAVNTEFENDIDSSGFGVINDNVQVDGTNTEIPTESPRVEDEVILQKVLVTYADLGGSGQLEDEDKAPVSSSSHSMSLFCGFLTSAAFFILFT